jgi:energy-converting hydrogenase Eha subunit F
MVTDGIFTVQLNDAGQFGPNAFAGESRWLNTLTKPPILGDCMLLAGKSIVGKHLLKTALERAFYPQPLPHRYFELVAASWLVAASRLVAAS